MSESTLGQFSEAVAAQVKGDRTKASELMSKALGSDTVLPVVADSIDKLVKPSELLGNAMLRQMLSVERKRKDL